MPPQNANRRPPSSGGGGPHQTIDDFMEFRLADEFSIQKGKIPHSP